MTDEEFRALQHGLEKVEKSVAEIDTRLRALVVVGTAEQISNRRSRFSEHGDWARHYSTVRMSVTTFLVSLSIGILSFKWEPAQGQPSLKFLALAAGVWVAALLLFLIFTHHTYREMANALRLRRLLPAGDDPAASSKKRKERQAIHPRQDWASWILIVLTGVFALLLLQLGNIGFAKPIWPEFSLQSLSHFISLYVPALVMLVAVWGIVYTLGQNVPDDGTPRR